MDYEKEKFQIEVPLSHRATIEKLKPLEETTTTQASGQILEPLSASDMCIPPDPYVTKEYTGFLPEAKMRYGMSCAQISSNIINRQSVEHPQSKRLFPDINDYSKSKDYPLPEEIEYLKSINHKGVPLPKYQGWVPGHRNLVGERQTAIQARCLVKLGKDMYKFKKQKEEFQHFVDSLKTGEAMKVKAPNQTDFLSRSGKTNSCGRCPTDKSDSSKQFLCSPYFSDPRNPQKFFITGYQGHKPFYASYVGMPNRIAAQYGLMEFYDKYLRAMKSEHPTTCYANSLDVSIHPRIAPSGGQTYPPPYPDIYCPLQDQKIPKDRIQYQELDKLLYLTGAKKP